MNCRQACLRRSSRFRTTRVVGTPWVSEQQRRLRDAHSRPGSSPVRNGRVFCKCCSGRDTIVLTCCLYFEEITLKTKPMKCRCFGLSDGGNCATQTQRSVEQSPNFGECRGVEDSKGKVHNNSERKRTSDGRNETQGTKKISNYRHVEFYSLGDLLISPLV